MFNQKSKKMTEELITSKSGLDLNEMIKDAEFQVEFYTKELKKNHETLYARKLALNALKKQRGIYKFIIIIIIIF